MPSVAFWLVVGAMAVAEAAIIVTALRMPLRAVARRGIVGSRAAEVVWTLLPVGLLAVLVVVSMSVSWG